MTASPGGRKKVADIVENLRISHVETRTEGDPDVRPYLHEKEIEILNVDLPDQLKAALEDIYGLIDDRLSRLKEMGLPAPDRKNLSMRALQELNGMIQQRIAERDQGFMAASIRAECMAGACGRPCRIAGEVWSHTYRSLAAEGATREAPRQADGCLRISVCLPAETAEGWHEECHQNCRPPGPVEVSLSNRKAG